jgi:hypothetical protein
MKKLLLILIALPLIFISCEDSNQAPSNSGNNSSSSNTYDWYFEIKVDGISNRIEGTFNDSSYIHPRPHVSSPNRGFISLGNPNSISAVLSNKGENTYISGESFSVGLNAANLNLGMNNFDLRETADFYESFIGVENFRWPSATSGTNGLSILSSFFLSPTDTNMNITSNVEFPINITQLPIASYYDVSNGDVNIGSPIEGSGSNTIYVLDSVLANPGSQNIFRYSRPYNIEINFKLYTAF